MDSQGYEVIILAICKTRIGSTFQFLEFFSLLNDSGMAFEGSVGRSSPSVPHRSAHCIMCLKDSVVLHSFFCVLTHSQRDCFDLAHVSCGRELKLDFSEGVKGGNHTAGLA